MKTYTLPRFYLAQVLFIFCMLFCSATTFAGYHVKDKKPDLDYDDTETNRKFGNLNFYVDYNLANDKYHNSQLNWIDDNIEYLSPGQMAFNFIIREEKGGGGTYDAWLEYGTIKYKREGESNWSTLAKVYRENDLDNDEKSNYSFAPSMLSNDVYGFHNTEKINNNIAWFQGYLGAYVNNQKYIENDDHNLCQSMRLVLEKIPESWYGTTVQIKFEGYWERNVATSDEGLFSNSINLNIPIPTVSVSDCMPVAETNSCDNKIPFSFYTPVALTEPHSSVRNDKSNIYLPAKKFKIKYRASGTTGWYQLNDSNFGDLDNFDWYTYTDDNKEFSTSLKNVNSGKEYEFKVIFKYMPILTNEYYFFGDETNIVKGSTMHGPAIPIIDSLVPDCNAATIYFHATDNDLSNIDRYKLFRNISIAYTITDGIGVVHSQTGHYEEIIDNSIPKNTVQYSYSMESFKTLEEIDSLLSISLDNVEIQSDLIQIESKNSCGDTKEAITPNIVPLQPPQNAPLINDITQEPEGGLITWEINQNEPTKEYSTFQVFRQKESEDELNLIADNIPFTTTSYLDENAAVCNKNDYRVVLYNTCGEIASNDTSIVLSSDFKEVIKPESAVASTGYFSNRIQIDWQYYPGFKDAVTGLKIFRKKTSDLNFEQVVYIDDNQTTQWSDMDAEANELYQYKLTAVGECYGEQTSDTLEVVGFRLKTGIVTGNISFEGGNPVEDVEVKISEGSSPTSSLVFNKVENDYLVFEDSTTFTGIDEFTIEMWVYSKQWKSISSAQNLIANRNFRLILDNGNLILKKFNTDNPSVVNWISYTASFIDKITDIVAWHHLAVSYSTDSVKLYFDGDVLGSFQTTNSEFYPFESLNTFIGARSDVPAVESDYVDVDYNTPSTSNDFNGNLDEFRFWSYAKSENDIARDCNRVIVGEEEGLVVYLSFDEGFGDKTYDKSKTYENFNKNNVSIIGAQWASFTPVYEQLHSSGISDEYGNYVIGGIPFSGTGEIFNVTPGKGVHVFSPSQKPLFIGDDQLVHNDVDFTDKSSFEVTVKVMYSNANYYPVSEVYVKIDGNYVMGADNLPLKTTDKGEIIIDVPIGNHNISVSKDGHSFVENYWPPKKDGIVVDFYFDEDFPEPIQFWDNTTIKLTGKVVGGDIEKNKAIGSKTNPTKNNVGTAKIEFNLVNTAFELHEGVSDPDTTIYTDSITGIYEIELIPEAFVITSVDVNGYDFISQSGATSIDLSNKFTNYYTIDTLQNGDVDTAFVYNHQVDYIMPCNPTFSILNFIDEPVIGDSYISILSDDETIQLPVVEGYPNNISYTFGYPVFSMGSSYQYNLRAYRKFTNYENGETDKVPVTNGVFLINNDIREANEQEEIGVDSTGLAVYTFIAGTPAIADPFLSSMNIQLETDDGIYDIPECPIQCYIIGTKPTGNNFVTNGPDQLQFILRDPYGSGSSATLSKGSSVTNTISQSVSIGTENDINFTTSTGTNITIATGVPGFMEITEVETVSENTVTTEINAFGSEGTTSTRTTQFNSSLSTSSSPTYVGSDGDIFYGNSTNIIFGVNRDICITKSQEPSDSETVIDSVQYNNEWYYLKRKNKLGVGTNFATEFIYTQSHIENNLLPNLKKLRNDLLANNPNYISVLQDVNDPNYGKDNDDPVFGTDPILLKTTEDGRVAYYGPSYFYFPDSTTYTSLEGEEVTFENLQNDSVRFLNNQIETWIYYLSLNEEQKLDAVLDDNHKNISFDAGSTYTGSITTSKSDSYTLSSGLYFSAQFTGELGFLAKGAGVKCELVNKQYINGEVSGGQNYANSVTTSFTLADSDLHNYFTMDVKKCQSGNGPVFSTRGGQTSCPYEGEELTEYFEPGQHILSNATVKIEVPQLSISTNNISGVPEDESAYFELYLSNESEADVDNWFTIITDNATNNGAALYMDGVSLASGIDVKVPAGETVTKTLRFEKVSPDIYNFENIRVLMKSRCDVSIYEEEYLSVSFDPTCSNVDIINLADEWVMNLSDNDTLQVEIGDYDLNNTNFKNIRFQYKRPGDVIPYTLMNFYKDSADYISTTEPNKKIIEGTTINWPAVFKTGTYSDGIYDIRAIAECNRGAENYYTFSPYLRGTIDRLAPHLFGLPQPADGVLSPNDEIKVKFNETIDEGFLYMRDDLISLRGIKNGTDLSASEYILHNACISFDGTEQHLLIPQGVNLKYTSFTVEFWLKRKQTGEECLIYQSEPGSNGLWIGFDENDKFTAIFNTDTIKTDVSFNNITDQWCHFAFGYNADELADNLLLSVFYDGGNETQTKTANSNYFETNPVYVGTTSSLDNGFLGEMHGLRIWNTALNTDDLSANKSMILTGFETGLIGYWPMDDAFGTKAQDLAFARHADMNASWQVSKKGKALNFDNNNFFSFNSGGMIFSDQTNFTIEFWYKTSTPSNEVYLFGNGLADGNDGYESAWAIVANSANNIIVRNNGSDFSFWAGDYFDNNWHHLAVTVNRRGNLNAYLDGELKLSSSATETTALGAANCYLGGSYNPLNNANHYGNFYTGGIDEVRIWNASLPVDFIQENMHSTLKGDEPGLKAYFPFEDVNETNMLISNASLDNFSESDYLNAGDGTVTNDAIISTITPLLKLSPPKSSIDFTYSINNDEVIITPTEEDNAIENINLEISMKRVKDLNGNEMASTEVWNAFVDKNQLVWDKQSITLEKDNESELTFTMLVYNKGGQVENFNILNLPSWLEVSSETGFIDPLQSVELTFTVNEALNTGNYFTDIYLNGSMNYTERLSIDLSVVAIEPNWIVNSEDYENSMILIGKIKIGDNFSTDTKDKVGAFINNECRGVANLQYYADYDIYLVNITIFGDSTETDGTIEFRIWDASEGFVYGDVTPTLEFVSEAVEGKPDDPIILYSEGQIAQQIDLAEGWNWVSFNLNSSKLSDINQLINSDMAQNCSMVKSFNQFSHGGLTDMNGNLQSFDYKNMYMFNMTTDWVLNYSGLPFPTSSSEIEIYPGWNWIGYTPQLKINLSEALSYFTPQNDDVLKGHAQFAMYSNIMGWIGSLEYLNPGEGYKYKSNSLDTFSFIYPREPILKSKVIEKESFAPFNIEANKWKDNMSLVGVFKTPENKIVNNLALIATNFGETRGFANPININTNDLLFLTIHGQKNERIQFFAMSLLNNNSIPLSEQLLFSADEINGTVENPEIFVLNNSQIKELGLEPGFTVVNCYPNPFSNKLVINIDNNNDENDAIVSIYSVDGKLQKKIITRESQIIWDGNNQQGNYLPSGIYHINVVIDDFVYNQKVVKSN